MSKKGAPASSQFFPPADPANGWDRWGGQTQRSARRLAAAVLHHTLLRNETLLKFRYKRKCEPDVAKSVVDPARAWPAGAVGRRDDRGGQGPDRPTFLWRNDDRGGQGHDRPTGLGAATIAAVKGLTALPVWARYAGGSRGRIAARSAGRPDAEIRTAGRTTGLVIPDFLLAGQTGTADRVFRDQMPT